MKKTATPAVLEANRRNAQKSTGPRQTSAVKSNAVTHGLLSKSLVFENDEEEAKYQEFAANLSQDYQPRNFVEAMLVEEVAVSRWKVQLADRLLFEQMNSKPALSAVLCEAYFDAAREREASIPGSTTNFEEMQNFTWECQQVVFSTGGSAERAGTTEPIMPGSQKKKGNGSLEVKFSNSAETLLRYGNAWRRDFYRALAALKAFRGE